VLVLGLALVAVGTQSEVEDIMMKASWLLQIIVAVVLLQTLFFKFSGAEESVYIFSSVGAEPWGRYASGVIELIAAILLLVPGYAPFGALLALGVISGAIVTHLTVLGIEVKGDGGLLFGLAVTVFVCSLAILAIRRRELRDLPLVGTALMRLAR
jgi:putative oxidoreductase